MKKLLFPLICFLSLTVSVRADDPQNDAKRIYSDLAHKSSALVKSYSGFQFNAMIVDGKPGFNVAFLRVDPFDGNGIPDSHYTKVLRAVDKDFNGGVSLVASTSASLTDFEPEKITFEKFGKRGGFGDWGDILQFNLFDSRGKVRVVQWLDSDTGFTLLTALFGSNGKLLSVNFISRLRINETPGDYSSLAPINVSLEEYFKRNPYFNGNDISEVVGLGNEILDRQVLRK